MPKATKSAQHEQHIIENVVLPEETSEREETSSDQEQEDVEKEVTICPPQAFPSKFMPYVEGPKMDWTANDNLYKRFLKWKLKCEKILEFELAMLAETRKCKKVIAWSGDFGIDQYVSCCLPPEELCLDVIWSKFEEFCKPQTNEVRAQFDLLTSIRQEGKSVDEWYNAVQAQINLAKYLQETARMLQRYILVFFSGMRNLCQRPSMTVTLI